MPTFEFAEWTPDQSPFNSPGSENIENVYPVARGYKPIRELVEISSNAVASFAKGYYAAHAADGAVLTFAGDANYLYSYSLVTFTNISRAGDAYTVQDDDQYWTFAQWGDRLLATSIENNIQYYDLTISLKFANLPGSPPRARHLGIVRDFVVLGNTVNSPSEVYWSGFNDSEGWTLEVNQCSSQTLQSGGWIQGVIGGEVGYIIQERQITKMTYVGPPTVFQFDVLDMGYGCLAAYSIVRVFRTVFYYGNDGFYMLDLATGQTKPIGSERVDRWFKSHVSGAYIKRMYGTADPVLKLVWWSFISNATSGTNHDRVIGFNWELGRWFNASFEHEIIVPAYTEAITLDEIDNFYTDLDLVPISLDSDYWMGGLTQLRAFTTNHKLALFEGDNLAAFMETTEMEPIEGRRAIVTSLRALTDASDATVTMRSRERLADDLTDATPVIMEANGDCSPLVSARYHRAKVSIPEASDWTYIQAVEINASDDGAI